MRRRWVLHAGMGALALGATVLVACGSGTDEVASPTPPTSSDTPHVTPPVPSSSASATSPSATTAGRAPTVVAVTAGSSAGSGEIEVGWDAVDGADGYRVLRADTPSGTFSISADVNITTGGVTVGRGVTNIWSETRTYYPSVQGVGTSGHFRYVEVVFGGISRRYFQVVAYNAFGEGPVSRVVCGAPVGYPQC